MRIITLVATALFVLAATSVYAADELATLNGVKATPMASSELAAVKGLHIHFRVITSGNGTINPDTPDAADPLRGSNFRVNNNENNLDGPDGSGDGNGPGYNGLGSCPGVITIPGTC